MRTAAVVLDDWKFPVFKEILDGEGYTYEESIGPLKNCITLKIETSNLSKLAFVINLCNQEAAKRKLN